MRLRGPVMALLWEQWRSVRLVFALALGGGLAVLWMNQPSGHGHYIDSRICWERAFFASLTVVAYGVFLLTDTGSWGEASFGVPTRQWRLPVPRGGFVLLYLHSRLFAIGALAALLGGSTMTVGVPYGDYDAQATLSFAGRLTALSITGLSAAYAAMLLSGVLIGKRARPFLAAVLLGVAWRQGVWHFGQDLDTTGSIVALSLIVSPLCTGVAALCALHGNRRSLIECVPTVARVGRVHRAARRFRSPLRAQTWYEWTLRERFLPRVLLFGGGGVYAIVVVVDLLSNYAQKSHTPGYALDLFTHLVRDLPRAVLVFLVPSALIAGLWRFSEERRESGLNRTPYARLMPISRAMGGSAQFLAACRGILMMFLIIAVLFLFRVMLDGTKGILPDRELVLASFSKGREGVPFFAMLTLLGCFAVAWSVYWSAVPLFAVYLLGPVLSGVASMLVPEHADTHPVLLAFVLGLPIVTVCLGVYAITRRAVAPTALSAAALLSISLQIPVFADVHHAPSMLELLRGDLQSCMPKMEAWMACLADGAAIMAVFSWFWRKKLLASMRLAFALVGVCLLVSAVFLVMGAGDQVAPSLGGWALATLSWLPFTALFTQSAWHHRLSYK